jgi:L-fucose mutarotase/ribose pyranase (RbsD/FucU family)
MHPLHHRDLDHRDPVHRLVHDLVYLQLLQHLDRLNDMDHLMLVHLFRCVVEIVNLDQMYQQDVVKMDVLQIQDEQNLDEVLTFLDAVRHFLVNLADVQVDAEPHHL